MNKQIIKDELRWLLEAINEQFEAIRHYDDKIPQIEFDILMENVRKMYESMRVLQRLNEFVPKEGRTSGQADGRTGGQGDGRTGGQGDGRTGGQADGRTGGRVEEPPAVTIRFDKPELKLEHEPSVLPNLLTEPDLTEPDLNSEPKADPIHTLPPKDFPFRPIAREVKKESPRKAPKPAAMDLFAAEEPAFSIRLKEAREKSFGPKVNSDRIDNLKTAITINDKFMFINELFEGNLREYNETIETLNGFRTLSQAGEFLDLVKRKNFWDTGSTAFKKLKELVERRF